MEVLIAEVNPELCSGYKICVSLCPYRAAEFDSSRRVAKIQEALCQGCGTCVAACPSGARTIKQKGFTDKQIMAELKGLFQKTTIKTPIPASS